MVRAGDKNKIEKEFDEISCAVQDIKICLNCGSENTTIVEKKIHCNYCEQKKSICGDDDVS